MCKRGMEAKRKQKANPSCTQKPNPQAACHYEKIQPQQPGICASNKYIRGTLAHAEPGPFFVRVRLREWQIQPEVQMRVEFFVGGRFLPPTVGLRLFAFGGHWRQK